MKFSTYITLAASIVQCSTAIDPTDAARGDTPDKPELIAALIEEKRKELLAHPIHFHVPDGKDDDPINNGNLFEGDIQVDFEDVRRNYGEKVATELVSKGLIKKLSINSIRNLETTTDPNLLWTARSNGKIVVPYTFAASSTHSAAQRTVVASALADLAAVTGVVTFVIRTNQVDYIEITSADSGCWSKIGRRGGKQQLNLQPNGCVSKGIVQHEFIHSLGFWHEQSRPDRDNFVDILWSNVIEDKKHNFEKRSYAEASSLGSPYDYGSVMHYGAYSFSKNGLKTIDSHGNSIGQRTGASADDITQIQLMYQCPGGPRNYVSFCTEDCPCKIGQGDCDNSNQCIGSAVCEFGASGNEKCRSIYDRCSPSKPCPENAGDCDTDDDCQGSLVCRIQDGVDICVKPLIVLPPFSIRVPSLQPISISPLSIRVPSFQPIAITPVSFVGRRLFEGVASEPISKSTNILVGVCGAAVSLVVVGAVISKRRSRSPSASYFVADESAEKV